jgi:hypothetical protein
VRRKALKGEAHERWRLKEASKEEGAEPHVKRVAKPFGVASRGQGNAFGTRLERVGEEKGSFFRICCRAETLTRGAY